MHDCALGALERLVRALNKVLTTLDKHLNRHVIRNEVLLDKGAAEVKVRLRR